MGKQKIYPVTSWDAAAKQIEAWTVFCAIFLGDLYHHTSTLEMGLVIKETKVFIYCLRIKSQQQSDFPDTFLL